MNRIQTYLLVAATLLLGSCSQLVYDATSFDSDGMYVTHNRDEITKNQSAQYERRAEQQSEYIEYVVPYDIYRYDWWGYRPFYSTPHHHRRHRYGYHYMHPFYSPYGYGSFGFTYNYLWDDPFYYDPYFYGYSGSYYSPFWYSSCFYHDWFYFGQIHAPRPGIVGGKSVKRTIVRSAAPSTAQSSGSYTKRNADGSTVGRSSSSSYNRGSTRSYSVPSYSVPSSSGSSGTYRSPSSGGSSGGSSRTNSIGR
ncbi:MAG: hypothetical protein R3Y68_05980 [Rikenellaceae bacterium]